MSDMQLTSQEEEEARAGAFAAKKATSPRRGKMSLKYKILLIITSLILMGVLRTGFMFIIIALLPAIVTYYVDVSATRYNFKTIFACNLCGLLPYAEKIIHHGPSSALLQTIMGNPMSWFIIYGSAVVGWLLVELCPMIAQIMLIRINQSQIGHIQRLQKKLEDEWGTEVTLLSNEPSINDD